MMDTHRPFRHFLDLLPHELFESVGSLGIWSRFVIVFSTVFEDESCITNEILWIWIHVFFVLFFHGCKIHWLFDNVIIVLNFVLINWLLERPRICIVLHVIEKMKKLIVVWTVLRCTRELIHVW